jgi:glycosyltransferase involved in cell wall biosynthesis
VRAIIAVNDQLASWAKEALRFPEDRVHFARNFVVTPPAGDDPGLPKTAGRRIVCVANVRPQKDIVNLVTAIAYVVREIQDIQVLVIGKQGDLAYLETIKKAIREHGLEERIILLGARSDVTDILARCDIGVLSSEWEGLPLSLIEYGMAGLATVATRVGQCVEVLGNGRYGILVPPGDPQSLAEAIIRLLSSDSEREAMGREFQRATVEEWGPDRHIIKIVDIYDSVLKQSLVLIGYYAYDAEERNEALHHFLS